MPSKQIHTSRLLGATEWMLKIKMRGQDIKGAGERASKWESEREREGDVTPLRVLWLQLFNSTGVKSGLPPAFQTRKIVWWESKCGFFFLPLYINKTLSSLISPLYADFIIQRLQTHRWRTHMTWSATLWSSKCHFCSVCLQCYAAENGAIAF